MPQSLSPILIHTVYSTKHRLPFLRDSELRGETHAYLAGCAKALDCLPIRIGETGITFTFSQLFPEPSRWPTS